MVQQVLPNCSDSLCSVHTGWKFAEQQHIMCNRLETVVYAACDSRRPGNMPEGAERAWSISAWRMATG